MFLKKAVTSVTEMTVGFVCVGSAWREMTFEVKRQCCGDLQIKALIKLFPFPRRIITGCNRCLLIYPMADVLNFDVCRIRSKSGLLLRQCSG